MTSRTRLFILVALVCISIAGFSQTGEQRSGEEPGAIRIKELTAFHDILHPLVHDAYPQKNYDAIRKALPDLIKKAKSLDRAPLPKELRQKKTEFRKEAKKLVRELTDLKKKAKRFSDDEFGEKFMSMHDTFENLMSLVR